MSEEFPLPLGIDERSGTPLPGVSDADLDRIDSDRRDVRQHGEPGAREHLAIADVDANNLAQAGWCVLYASDVDPVVRDALRPLLEHRAAQAPHLFKEFSGDAGVRAGEDARRWVERHGAGFSVVDPERGVPLYVLIVGSPQQISFEFQYLLDLFWNVGRLELETADEYRAYAESVVAYETGARVAQRKRSALFVARNPGDRATGLLHNQVAVPLTTGTSSVRTLNGVAGFTLTSLLGADATKERLASLLCGREAGGPPALLFTGTHGIKVDRSDAQQRERQGALVCQDWPGFDPVGPSHVFSAADVPADAQVHGLIHMLFACYGGGWPREDNFGLGRDEAPRLLAEQPAVSRLPQRLLARGALASLAHIDRAWTYSFQNSRGTPQVHNLRDVLVRILQGNRLGEAVDGLNRKWAVLSAELQEAQGQRAAFDTQLVSNATLANRWIARNDARNYIILGDPAVRLRTEVME